MGATYTDLVLQEPLQKIWNLAYWDQLSGLQ